MCQFIGFYFDHNYFSCESFRLWFSLAILKLDDALFTCNCFSTDIYGSNSHIIKVGFNINARNWLISFEFLTTISKLLMPSPALFSIFLPVGNSSSETRMRNEIDVPTPKGKKNWKNRKQRLTAINNVEMIIAIACTSKQRRKKQVKKVEERRGEETESKRKGNYPRTGMANA